MNLVAKAKGLRAAAAARRDCQSVQALTAQWGDGVIAGGSRRTLLLGDSFTQGAFLDAPLSDSWAVHFATLSGDTVLVDGIAGSGFTAPGPCGDGTFADRLDLGWNPDRVIVQGGANDLTAPADVVALAARELLGRITVPVTVLGPPPMPARGGPALAELDVALSQATGDAYVSTLGWELEYLDDGTHLTPEGHRRFAELASGAVN